jgi:hypothetical protein
LILTLPNLKMVPLSFKPLSLATLTLITPSSKSKIWSSTSVKSPLPLQILGLFEFLQTLKSAELNSTRIIQHFYRTKPVCLWQPIKHKVQMPPFSRSKLFLQGMGLKEPQVISLLKPLLTCLTCREGTWIRLEEQELEEDIKVWWH